MTDRNEESAFPASDNSALLGYTGMTLRDWFASQALAGLNANPSWDENGWDQRAKQAYKAADAMLEARK